MSSPNHEKTFYYRYCLVFKNKYEAIVNYMQVHLEKINFQVKKVEDNERIVLLLSFSDEERALREAQYSKIRKVYTKNPHSTEELKLPAEVVLHESKKNFIYKNRNDYVADYNFDALYNHKKTDERWGYDLFTESEMLYIEYKMLSEMEIGEERAFLGLLRDSSLEPEMHDIFKSIENEKSLFYLLTQYNIISEHFPLHVADFKENILMETIFSVRCPYRKIRSYYGDKVAIYYAWVYHYTRFLTIPAAVAILFLTLIKYFGYSGKTLLTLYAIVIAIWTQLFVVFWTRKCSEISIEWDNFTEEYDRDNIRREFKGEWRKSPVTEQYEKYYSESKRKVSYIISALISLPFLLLALLVNICFLNLSGFIQPHMNSIFEIEFLGKFSEEGHIFAPGTFPNTMIGIIQVICVQLINKFYREFAKKTCDMENHKIKSNYENSLIIKRFIFEFFDGFISLFYLAFVAQNIPALKGYIVNKFF